MAKSKFFRVLYPTGPHMPGEVIEVTDEHVQNGVDTERLVALGAVEPYEESTKDVRTTPVGTSLDADRNAAPFPGAGASPADAAPEPVSPDPLRSENPPTLPEEGVKPETTQIKGRVSDKPKPARVEAE